MRILSGTLRFIGVVQMVFGVIFLVVPGPFAAMTGLAAPPVWVYWLFAMMSARFLGFGYGMFVAARDPLAHRSWVIAMIAVQAIDWFATLTYLLAGHVTLAQVSTAAFLPVIFIALLVWFYPRPAEARS